MTWQSFVQIHQQIRGAGQALMMDCLQMWKEENENKNESRLVHFYLGVF